MAIVFHKEQNYFSLTTNQTEYQIKIDRYGHVLHSHYGNIVNQDMSYLFSYEDRGFSGSPAVAGTDRTYSLDVLPQEYPVFGMGDYREGALELENADGSYGVEFVYKEHKILDEKYSLQGLPASYRNNNEKVSTLEITLMDDITQIEVKLLYGVFEEKDIITRATKVVNLGKEKINLLKVDSVSLDKNLEKELDVIHFHGRHNMERQYERTAIGNSMFSIGSHRGSSSHQHNPFMILCDKETTEAYGESYGVMLMYSGNFLGTVEKTQFNQVRSTMGIGRQGFRYPLEKGEEFIAPEVILSFSNDGLTKLSQNYHTFIKNNVVRGEYKYKRRPILINNWEATYFDFDEEKLLDIARESSEVGIELLVMDDGWFGKRNDDNTGLGDWFVNLEKIPGGLRNLTTKVNQMGMKFGIWFEPEMVSEDSDLYRKHPEWSINIPNRTGVRSRNQFVLDLSRADVRDYLVEQISAILDSGNIEYLKWDMNRSLSNIYSESLKPSEQGKFYHLYVLGVYEILERLTSAYPYILFEGCSGGGGRFDAGMLYYTPQIWTSDNTDAIDRLRIQHGTSFGYPINTNGSHVSAVPNHQTGRITPLATRGMVAMTGTFGYELDITSLSKEEKEAIKKQISHFKENYETIQEGEYYRLSNPWENEVFTAWQIVSKTRDKILLNIIRTRQYANDPIFTVKLKGLMESSRYRLIGTDKVFTGASLMNGGWEVPRAKEEYQGFEFEFEVVE